MAKALVEALARVMVLVRLPLLKVRLSVPAVTVKMSATVEVPPMVMSFMAVPRVEAMTKIDEEIQKLK